MRRAVAALTELGCNVIVDDLLFKRAYLDDYVDVLNAEKTWFIGVKCSLDVVHKREALRPGRFPGTAVSHYDQVHAHGVPYDLEVDTSDAKASDLARSIIARLHSAPSSFRALRADYWRAKRQAQQVRMAHAVLTLMGHVGDLTLIAREGNRFTLTDVG